MRRAGLLLGLLASASAGAAEDQLVRAPGWEIAARNCGACHSYSLVTAQRGDARFWTQLIRWMQATQGLWEIPPADEAALITYLATQYGGEDFGRRPQIPARLLPPDQAIAASNR